MLPTHRTAGGTPVSSGGVIPAPDQPDPVSYRLFTYFMESEVWQLSLRPLYQRTVVPLCWIDTLCIAIGVAACFAIKRFVCQYQNFYARPLGILAAAACLSIVYHVVTNRINQHFNSVAQGLLRQLNIHVQAATPQDNRVQEFDQILTSLSTQFEHLGESHASIFQQLRVFRTLLVQTPPNFVEIERQRTALMPLLQGP
jgi:hypothetical protein